MNEAGTLRLRLTRDVEVPAKVRSHQEFSETILSLWRLSQDKLPSKEEGFAFLCSMYYLLGWLVGDAGKGMGSRKRHTVRIRYELSKRHTENLELGNYVKQVIQNLGVWCERMEDRPSRKYKPLESYYWDSHYSPIFGWMFTACLGLEWDQLTSYDPVVMDWVLIAPEEMRIWFLRGLADSDGDVDFRDRSVSITSQPNTDLVSRLLTSLSIRNSISRENKRDVARVSFSVSDAVRIGIFNPVVMTHRRKLLEKLTNARTFQRKWPLWLEARVETLLSLNLGMREICETLLEEDNVYVKYNTLKRKRSQMLERAAIGTLAPLGFDPKTYASVGGRTHTKASLYQAELSRPESAPTELNS